MALFLNNYVHHLVGAKYLILVQDHYQIQNYYLLKKDQTFFTHTFASKNTTLNTCHFLGVLMMEGAFYFHQEIQITQDY